MRRPTAHLVADARLRDDEVWVACTCGVTLTADDAEAMYEVYQRHRTDDGSPRGEASVRHDGVYGNSWKKGGNDIFPSGKTSADYQRAFRERNPERVREIARAYRERKRAKAAA